MSERRIALVTGANRGIGRAISHGLARAGFHVILASREQEKAAEVAAEIHKAGGSAEAVAMDVANPDSVRRAAESVAARHPRLDALVNNAGIMLGMQDTVLTTSRADLELSLATNTFGPLEVVKAFLPLLRKSPAARVVNLSSTTGSITETVKPDSPYAAVETASYRLSKIALNGITGLLAKALRSEGILVNSMCPGWVRTDMGGPSAPKSPDEGADTAIWLATLPNNGPTGGFFADRKPIPW